MVGAACTEGAGAGGGVAPWGGAKPWAAGCGAGAGAGTAGPAGAPNAGGAADWAGRRERRRGGLRCRGGGLLLGDLAAEVLQQRVEPAVEALSDRGEPPYVLEIEVAQHHGALGGELATVERVAGHLLAARDDAEVPGGDLRHLSGAVDRRRERQLLDLRRDPVERDAEGLRVARLRAEKLDGLFGRLRLVEEDEVPVVRKPFVGVQTEAADVEAQSGAGDLHTYVQIGARGEVTDLGLVAALEFPGHA